MRGTIGDLPWRTRLGRALAAAAALVLTAAACGGGSGADAAKSLASLAAGGQLVGELRMRGAVSAVYARRLLDDLRGEVAKEAAPLRKPDAGPGAPTALGDAVRLDSALAAMRRAVAADDAPRLRRWARETGEIAQSLSETASAMQGGAGG